MTNHGDEQPDEPAPRRCTIGELSVLDRMPRNAMVSADIPTLVRAIYIGLDPRLTKAAGLSVLAHLEDLVARGVATTDGAPSIEGRYRLAVGAG